MAVKWTCYTHGNCLLCIGMDTFNNCITQIVIGFTKETFENKCENSLR